MSSSAVRLIAVVAALLLAVVLPGAHSSDLSFASPREIDRDLLISQFVCDAPSNGCTNGMFNVEKCECECITPFCHDAHGDCTLPTNNCGGNPWMNCQKGRDCPWWKNHLKADSCTTGSVVPGGTWEIFATREDCCKQSIGITSYSTCNPTLATGNPTKHPTISRVEGDDFEIVPIRFDIAGLPDDVQMSKLRRETLTVLKRILVRLSEKIEGLKVSNVEERTNRYLKELEGRYLKQMGGGRKLREVSLMYDVYVVRDEDGRKFGPVIIDYMKQNYGEVLEQIQTSPDINYFNSDDVEMNFCTSENGRYSNCVYSTDNDTPASSPISISNNRPTVNNNAGPSSTVNNNYGSSPTSINVQSDGDDGGGLAGWAVFLIILFVLLILCCIGYAIFYFCCGGRDRRETHNTKEVNNIYFDNDHHSRGYDDHDESSYFEERSRASASTRRSRHTARHHNEEEAETAVLAVGKDPTYYVPGQEHLPDPETASGRMYYIEDGGEGKPDPTMYVDGTGKRDPTMYIDGQSYASDTRSYMDEPSVGSKPRRDPTMYVDGTGRREPSVYFEGDGGRDPTMYVDQQDEYGAEGMPSPHLDSSGRSSSRSEDEDDEGPPVNRKGSAYADQYEMSGIDESFRTQEPSVSGKSRKSSRSKKSGRSGRR